MSNCQLVVIEGGWRFLTYVRFGGVGEVKMVFLGLEVSEQALAKAAKMNLGELTFCFFCFFGGFLKMLRMWI